METLRFFADHCVSNFAIQTLRDAGHKVLRLSEYIPANSADKAVISKAQERDAILISLNGDFADIVTYPPAHYKGILALQVRNRPEVIPQIMAKLKDYLIGHSDPDDYKGTLFLIEAHRIRTRK